MDERKWSEVAISCYQRGCVCKDCPMQEIMESKCMLKYTVIKLVKRWGIPEELERNRIL